VDLHYFPVESKKCEDAKNVRVRNKSLSNNLQEEKKDKRRKRVKKSFKIYEEMQFASS